MLPSVLSSFLSQASDLVILVSDEYPPETGFGGIGSYTRNMSRGLASQGCRVVVISKGLKRSSCKVEDNIAVIRFAYASFLHRIFFKFCQLIGIESTVRSLIFAWHVYWQIRQIKRVGKVLAIEGPEWHAQLFFVAWLTKWPIVVRIHTPLVTITRIDAMLKTLDIRLMLRFESFVAGRAAAILYASDLSLNDAQHGGLISTHQKRFKVPLPISDDFFAIEHKNAPDPTMIFLGRIEPKKGINELIEALAVARNTIANIQCLIIGPDGKDQSGRSMRRALEQRISELQLAQSVKFVGSVAYDVLPTYFENCWLFVNPSKFESFGMTSLEALTAGARVILYDSIGFAEWMRPAWGRVIKAHDISGMAAAIVAELKKAQPVDRKTVYDEFSTDRIAKQVLDIYRSL